MARERAGTRGGADYLPQLQQELLAVIARYEKIDLSNVTVNLDRHGGSEVLELNIMLPEAQQPPAPPARRARRSRQPSDALRAIPASKSAAFTGCCTRDPRGG